MPKQIALFTGAGASRAIGYPLTSELFPRLRAELKTEELFDGSSSKRQEDRDRRDLSRLLRDLLPGLSKVGDHRLPLITDLFSLVEYAIAMGEALPIGGERNLRRCRDLLRNAITDILLGDFLTPWDTSDPEQREQKRVLTQFVRWIQAQPSIGVITTNYDIGLEYELYKRLGDTELPYALDLGFDWRDIRNGRECTRPAHPSLRMYKLHGSLDLLKCRYCGYVYFNRWGAISGYALRDACDEFNTCHCRDSARLELHIVAPSLVRQVQDANLLSVWRSAFEWMRKCKDWFIVGYSLPPEDLAIRSLLLRAYKASDRAPRVTVVQQGDAERARYELLFPGCNYEPDGLAAFLGRFNQKRRTI